MTCHACGAALAPSARFCHKCGAQAGGAHAAGWRAGLPWGVAGLALGALMAVVGLRLGAARAQSADDPTPVPAGAGLRAPDISQLSPEERATRLYNRVMRLHSAGQAESAARFLPMARQAYAMLPALDVDARYHIGVLALTVGDAAAALAQADTIRRALSTHLFAFMLRARALELRHDTAGALHAYREFLLHETAERARQRPEYRDHADNLDSFHAQATAASGGTAGPRGR